jgi:hypothetical protein
VTAVSEAVDALVDVGASVVVLDGARGEDVACRVAGAGTADVCPERPVGAADGEVAVEAAVRPVEALRREVVAVA